MARRGARMPLYEVMRSGQRRLPASSRADEDDGGVHIGSVVRLPIGIVLVIAGAGVIGLVLAFSFGFQRGTTEARDQYEDQIRDAPYLFEPDPAARGAADGDGGTPAGRPIPGRGTVLDPPPDGLAAGDRADDGAFDDAEASVPGGGVPDAPSIGRPRSEWGAVESDPREDGLYYFVLAETDRTGALRIVDFLRERGVEAYGVARNNGRLRVLLMPGFRTPDRSAPEVARFAEQIARVGRAWKRAGGHTDFGDAYMSLF